MTPILKLDETSSTNEYLKNMLTKRAVEDKTIVVADYQSGGKGQRGNSWESEREKNLLFSIVLYPKMIKANEQFIISQLVSLAIKEMLDKYASNITIKWPNDVYWKDKKIGGVLIENTLDGDTITQSIIGVGININQTKFESDAPNPVSLKQITKKDFDPNSILIEITDRIFNLYGKSDSEEIRTKYRQSLFRREGYHLYYDGVRDLLAKIKAVESTGTLVLETIDGEERRFGFKEVVYIL